MSDGKSRSSSKLESEQYVEHAKKLEREFAKERSHQDAKTSTEHARAIFQAVILINGAAATAVLTYYGNLKSGASQSLRDVVPYCLGSYSSGILCGMFAGFCYMMTSHHWNVRWQLMATWSKSKKNEDRMKKAMRWRQIAIGITL